MPVIRQKGGRPVKAGCESEMARVPDVTDSASVMVVFSAFRDFSEVQSAARRDIAHEKKARARQQSRARRFK
jgi:hypothetical protein